MKREEQKPQKYAVSAPFLSGKIKHRQIDMQNLLDYNGQKAERRGNRMKKSFEDQDKRNFGILMMWFPFLGWFVSGMAAFMNAMRHRPWTLEEALATLVYGCLWTLVGVLVCVFGGKQFYMTRHYFQGKRKLLAAGCILFFIGGEICFFLTGA